MKKPVWSKNKMKQIIDSGYKEFDRQTNLISTGNVIANTQYSSYIRPYNKVDNGGYTGKPGDFLAFDMRNFRQISQRIRDIIYDKDRQESVILYQFSVSGRIIGHVLTDNKYRFLAKDIADDFNQHGYKRRQAIAEAMKYICHESSVNEGG